MRRGSFTFADKAVEVYIAPDGWKLVAVLSDFEHQFDATWALFTCILIENGWYDFFPQAKHNADSTSKLDEGA